MATQGPNGPGTAAEVTYSLIPWSGGTIDYAKVEGEGNYATFSAIGTYKESDWLKLTNFGFSIPGGSTINGVLLEIKRFNSGSGGPVADLAVKLTKGGSFVGSDYYATGDWPGSLTYKTYGGASDLWGTTLSVADVNASDFGFGIIVWGDGSSKFSNPTASIDYARMTIYYTAGATGNPKGPLSNPFMGPLGGPIG